MLIEYLKENDKGRKIFYLETGKKFREFIKGKTHASKLSRKIYEDGDLQPSFLAVWTWADVLVENLVGDEHLVIDGTPRKLREAHILDSAFKFFGRFPAHIIFINVSKDWSRERLMERGRQDDVDKEDVERRLHWFDTDVAPTIEMYKDNSDYHFVEINGEQTIPEVHEEVMQKLHLK